MNFSHLNDTRFPNIDTVDVYSFQNKFDYTRWNENTKVRLVNVIWNSDYNNVVLFDSNAARDSYFDNVEDTYNIDLTQAARIVPEGYVKLPIPYDVIARYNYLYIEMPIATSIDAPIDYETTDGKRRWYFFIDSIVYRAPNTTEVRLSLDVWTNFHNDININYMMLERGHAPVAKTSVSEYLENPIQNNNYLLAPDVDFARDSVVRDADYIPFGNGEKYVVFSSTCSPDNISDLGVVTTSGTADAWGIPTYSNTQDRYGYQLQVNGYTFGDSGDFSNLQTPVGNGQFDKIANNLSTYAIQADECFGNGTFLSDIIEKCPSFMNTILAFFVVPVDMLTFDGIYTIAGHNVYSCSGVSQSVGNITLTKSMFGYPEKYERFAKLYTFPYAFIEMVDNDQKKIQVRIEDTGNIGYNLITSVAFPYLNMRVFFTGIGGIGSQSYSWKNLDGSVNALNMPNGDWFENCFDWQIPTYGLFMDGKTAYNLHNYNGMDVARRNALVNYHNSVRSANTAYENAVALANTAESNVNANAATMIANNANNCNTNTANTLLTTTTNTANTDSANQCGSYCADENAYQNAADNEAANTLVQTTAQAQNEVTVATTHNTNHANIFNGAISGALSGAVMGSALPGTGTVAGGVLGGIIGAGTASSSAAANASNATIITNCSSALAGLTTAKNNTTAANANRTIRLNQVSMNADRTRQNNNTNDCLTNQTVNNNNCATQNTSNSAATMNANAERTRSTSNSNSGYTREVDVLNAKEILENAQARTRAAYNDARNNAPIQYGSYTGSNAPDYMQTRGIQFKIRTEPDSAIAQAGDTFARYGYALNQIWDVNDSGLQPMNHFCYWKASDIWVDDKDSSNNVVNRAIERIFLNGVTVWSNPDEIGKVSIYAN